MGSLLFGRFSVLDSGFLVVSGSPLRFGPWFEQHLVQEVGYEEVVDDYHHSLLTGEFAMEGNRN